MKITKRQLKRIIREEKTKLLEADPYGAPPRPGEQGSADEVDLYVNLSDEQDEALFSLEQALEACWNAGCKKKDMLDTIGAILSAEPSFDERLGLTGRSQKERTQ